MDRETYNIGIVDGHPIMLTGIARTLESVPFLSVVLSACGPELFEDKRNLFYTKQMYSSRETKI